jgi:predicted esterase
MTKQSNFYIKFIALLMLFYTAEASAIDAQIQKYLLKPTGNYDVGYQDIFLINKEICPDAFYHENMNEIDFTPANKKYCHEVMLRVYYPSLKPLQKRDKYYAPFLLEINRWAVKKNKFSSQDAAKLNDLLNIKTYTCINAEPFNKRKFPIVLFMPGSGASAQTYNNVISNLVSNGYIVIGINSLFINGALKLSNDHVVLPPKAYLDVDGRMENMSDLKFVLDHLTTIKYKFNLEKHIDFNSVALIGHSRGAMSIVNLLKQNKNYNHIKSILLMDPADMLMQANYPLPSFSVPSMIMWSAYFKKEVKGEALLGKNNYEVILKPKNASDAFSHHNNFSDQGTLQYHPAYRLPFIHRKISVGEGNGYEIATAINYYALTFLNNYLQNKGPEKNLECKDFNDIYLIKCGQ